MCNGSYFYILQIIYLKESSSNRFSDAQAYTVISNDWLNIEIPVRKTQRTDGLYEYSAYIEIDNAYYYIQGVLEEEQFISIVENVSF